MPASTFIGHFLGPDTHSNRPAAAGLPNGTQYVCTTHGKIERVVSGAWVDYATLGIPAGTGVVATDPIFDAKGDLVAATAADTASRLAVGSNGQVLTADSTQATGVKWALLPKRQLVANWAGTLPTSAGDSLVFAVPYILGAAMTFNLSRAKLRAETAGGSSTVVTLAKSSGGGAFSPTTIVTLTLTAANYEVANTGLTGTVSSGDLVRLSFGTLGTTGVYSVQLQAEEA